MNRRSRQSGAALMMVLLLVSVMLVLAVTLVDGVRYSSQRLINQRLMDQGYWYAHGGEIIAKYALEDIANEAVVALNQNWARNDIVFPIEGGSIAGQIWDEQACFNMNSLYLPELEAGQQEPITAPQQVFTALLENLEISSQRADFIISRLRDWIDEDYSPEGVYGAEDLFYGAKSYPYIPPNAVLDNISELRLFAEFEEDEQALLAKHICAIPELQSAININTLNGEQGVLLAAAVGNVISVERASEILQNRPVEGWPDVASFVVELALPVDEPLAPDLVSGLAVKSRYFKGLADVFYEQRQLRIYSRFVLKQEKAIAYAREYGEVF